jgi:hypothetical protein
VSIDGIVTIGLPAADEHFASQMVAQFGDRVSVQVGSLPYPIRDPPPPSHCPQLVADAAAAGLEIGGAAQPSQLPPGTYQLVALVQHERDTVRSTPLQVEVTASG